jgi:Na+-translocating ferredoxin:NAD+ oxidoreductase RnfA subunit
MRNSGCCGADEFLKLWAYTLVVSKLIRMIELKIYIEENSNGSRKLHSYGIHSNLITYNHAYVGVPQGYSPRHGLHHIPEHGRAVRAG